MINRCFKCFKSWDDNNILSCNTIRMLHGGNNYYCYIKDHKCLYHVCGNCMIKYDL